MFNKIDAMNLIFVIFDTSTISIPKNIHHKCVNRDTTDFDGCAGIDVVVLPPPPPPPPLYHHSTTTRVVVKYDFFVQ